MTNAKVKNAVSKEYNGIKFKSLLEVRVYKKLLSIGINPTIGYPITLQEGFKPNTISFLRQGKKFGINQTKIRSMTYTPDFIISKGKYTVYIETKGFKTDSYKVKIKLFRKWLESQDNVIFAEVNTLKELDQLIIYIQQELNE